MKEKDLWPNSVDDKDIQIALLESKLAETELSKKHWFEMWQNSCERNKYLQSFLKKNNELQRQVFEVQKANSVLRQQLLQNPK